MRFPRTPALLAASVALATTGLHAQAEPPASGLALWISVPSTSIQEITAASAGRPRFAVGFRTGRLQLGVGLGHVSLRTSARDSFDFTLPSGSVVPRSTEDEITATLFQIGPAVLVDLWRSGDRRARANIGAGLGIGRLSLVQRDEFVEFPSGDIDTTEDKTTGTLLGLHLSLGGDYFLHPHFALGAEAGYQVTAAFDVEPDDEPPSGERFGAGANGTYVALRLMVVF